MVAKNNDDFDGRCEAAAAVVSMDGGGQLEFAVLAGTEALPLFSILGCEDLAV